MDEKLAEIEKLREQVSQSGEKLDAVRAERRQLKPQLVDANQQLTDAKANKANNVDVKKSPVRQPAPSVDLLSFDSPVKNGTIVINFFRIIIEKHSVCVVHSCKKS